LFSTSNTITAIKTTKKRVAEHVACMEETNTSGNVFGNPAGERHRGRSRRRWMILMWILWKYGVDWIRGDQRRDKEGAVLDRIRYLRQGREWRQTFMNTIVERWISKHGGETTEWLRN
jgi:hypothetical protein